MWTAPSWQGFPSRLQAGRCSHVFGLLVRHTRPLAIMPSADQVPVKTAHSTEGIRSSITKMRTSIPQDLIDYGNSRKVTCGGDHYFSSDSWVGPFTTEGDRTWTSKLYGCGGVGVSTSRKSRFIRSWSSSSRLCRSTFQPEGQRVTRLGMHRARLAVVPGRPWLQRRERLGRVLINPAQCPLRSESDRIAAGQRNDAMCHKRL